MTIMTKLYLSRKPTQACRDKLLFGIEKEAKEFAKILGYNYNSSEWYEKSCKILNKDYKIKR